MNAEIKVPEVRLIGSDGQPVGIVPTSRALEIAESEELDLVLISEDANPPVCKILNYSKYKYNLQKKKAEAKKKQKIIALKEIQFRPFIGENDLLVKCKAIQRFILDGDKVKVVLKFRGRELSRKELGYEVINKVLETCSEFAKPEMAPKLEGSIIITVLTKK
ncbi:MAG: translation initiation factor IF-3 [Alphaproteobacteria bacterium]|nr:translation initiation factor IF-3 [Alphaproteobacteria bacterium]